MLFPWYQATMLAFESNRVIGQRMVKLAWGGKDALDETVLMISEKVDAAIEASRTVMMGGGAEAVIGRYREHVAANAGRLS
jgi:hypothetical protein